MLGPVSAWAGDHLWMDMSFSRPEFQTWGLGLEDPATYSMKVGLKKLQSLGYPHRTLPVVNDFDLLAATISLYHDIVAARSPLGHQVFSVAGLMAWNALPDDLKPRPVAQCRQFQAQNQAPRPSQPEPAICGRFEWVHGISWESKQAHRMIHQPVSVVSQCGAGAWLYELASTDQCWLTGSSTHLRCVCDDPLYKYTVTLLNTARWNANMWATNGLQLVLLIHLNRVCSSSHF